MKKKEYWTKGAEESYSCAIWQNVCGRTNNLLIFFAAPLISSLLNVGANWAYTLPGTALAVKKLPHMFR